MKSRILVVDDEPELLYTLKYNLTKEGYEVLTAPDGEQALKMARECDPDLVVLDIVLPGMDGFEVCRELRRDMDVPVLMLTGRVDDVDRVVGLEVGADCYVTKPFNLRVLLAQMKALLRRARTMQPSSTDADQPEQRTSRVELGDLVIDLSWHRVTRGGQVLPLRPKEFQLLVLFAKNRGKVLTRERLVELVWGYDYNGDTRMLDVYIHWLREKIEKDPNHPEHIQTIRGVGYCFSV